MTTPMNITSVRFAPVVAMLASSVLAGCTGGSHSPTPDGGAVDWQDPRASVCTRADAAGQTAAPPFDVIQQIFDENCVSCHTHGADLDLSPGLAWGDLVGASPPIMESCGGTLVVAGDPNASYLLQKISTDQPCYGMRMPRTEFAPDPLPECAIALVRNWIVAGAPGPANGDGGGN
jgi:hypothetical protein